VIKKIVARDGSKRLGIVLLFLSCGIFATLPGFATQSVSLGWDPSPDANVVGYNVSYGPASRGYTNISVAGNTTNILISGLVGGATYYFAATAYDVAGTESDYSNEVSYSVPATNSASTNAPPFIIGLPNLSITANSATTNMPFVIGDPDTSVANLTVWVVCSNPSLVPLSNIVIGGTGANRTCKVTPAPNQSGVAPIVVYVTDDTGNTVGDTFLLTVVAGAVQPLVLQTSGSGTVTPNLAAQTLTLGKTYSLTATPAAGQLFSGWSGGLVSASAKLKFTLVSNLVLQANFIPNPYLPASGSYNGLFSENAGVAVPSAGSFTASLTSGGTYSGKLQLAGRSTSFTGKMSLQCRATNIIKSGTTLLTLVLQAGSGNQAGQISGYLTDGTWISPMDGDRARFNATTNPAPQAGSYTMMIAGQYGDAFLPAGHSFGFVKVTSGGTASLAGTLADGTKISQSVPLSQDGTWPLYIPLYSGKGLITSWQMFRDHGDGTDFDGNLVWLKLTNSTARFYPAGFSYQHHVFGEIYLPPAGTNTVMNSSVAQVNFLGGYLPANFGNLIQFDAGNKIINLSSNKLSMVFSLPTGTFTGTVTDPTLNQTWSFSGALMQRDNAAYGFLLGTNASSQTAMFPN
jgi:Divergent InlB B-repeat domain/Fibronectin type III domain